MADLPSDLFTEILSRLPVQSLLRFRSTSKSLKSLIDSHNFTNLYLKNSLNLNLILFGNSEFYQTDLPNLTTTVSLNHHFRYRPVLLGSCNGLLCISNSINEIALWNPTIRKHQIIPYVVLWQFPFHWGASQNILFHGFGFDLFGYYKLVRISCCLHLPPGTFDSQVRLFSSKTNCCKILPDMQYALYNGQTMNVVIENSLHLVVRRKPCPLKQSLIVAFNLTREIFNEVPLPEIQASASEHFRIDVSLLGECLCLIVTYQTLEELKTTKVDVWVMEEYGFRDSWCKLFTLDESCFITPLLTLKPLAYSSNRSKVLLQVDRSKLFWFDLKSEKVTCVQGIPNFDEAMIYVGTLLPPSLPIDNSNYMKEKPHTS